MSSWTRTKRRALRNFLLRMKTSLDVINIAGWDLIEIHITPKVIEYGIEFDYWASNGKDCYLIRFRRSLKNIITFIPRQKSWDNHYIIFESDFNSWDKSILESYLIQLRTVGIPKRGAGNKTKPLLSMPKK